MSEIGLLGALLGGVLSLLSPCAALLLPSFFAYAFERVGTLVARTTVFLAGLVLVLVPLGAGVAAASSAITRYRETVTLVGAIVIIAFGLLSVTEGGSAARPRNAGPDGFGSPRPCRCSSWARSTGLPDSARARCWAASSPSPRSGRTPSTAAC